MISQFLSPVSNLRKDKWGGSLENRARILYQIIRKIRSAVGSKNFILGLKINSADFLKGGLSIEDSGQIIKKIDEMGLLDFVELSGGTYENPVCQTGLKESTRQREGHFIEMSYKIQQELKDLPMMVTGGFRTKKGMNQALMNGIDLIGVGKPLCLEPNLPSKLLSGKCSRTVFVDQEADNSILYF